MDTKKQFSNPTISSNVKNINISNANRNIYSPNHPNCKFKRFDDLISNLTPANGTSPHNNLTFKAGKNQSIVSNTNPRPKNSTKSNNYRSHTNMMWSTDEISSNRDRLQENIRQHKQNENGINNNHTIRTYQVTNAPRKQPINSCNVNTEIEPTITSDQKFERFVSEPQPSKLIENNGYTTDTGSVLSTSTFTLEYQEEYDDRFDTIKKYAETDTEQHILLKNKKPPPSLNYYAKNQTITTSSLAPYNTRQGLKDSMEDIMSDVPTYEGFGKTRFSNYMSKNRTTPKNDLLQQTYSLLSKANGTEYYPLKRKIPPQQPSSNRNVLNTINKNGFLSLESTPLHHSNTHRNQTNIQPMIMGVRKRSPDHCHNVSSIGPFRNISTFTVNKCRVEREIYNDMVETAKETNFPMRYADTKVPIYRNKYNIIGSLEDMRKFKAMRLIRKFNSTNFNAPAYKIDLNALITLPRVLDCDVIQAI